MRNTVSLGLARDRCPISFWQFYVKKFMMESNFNFFSWLSLQQVQGALHYKDHSKGGHHDTQIH